MTDRIEPIRPAGARVPPVPAVLPRRERREDPQRDRGRRERPAPEPSITRDEDGTPHVDARA